MLHYPSSADVFRPLKLKMVKRIFSWSYLDIMTVHAPQPPSLHPSLVPVNPTEITVKVTFNQIVVYFS